MNSEKTRVVCRQCGRAIRYIKLQDDDREIPIDGRRIFIVTSEGRVLNGFRSHNDTCRGMRSWRRRPASYAKQHAPSVLTEDLEPVELPTFLRAPLPGEFEEEQWTTSK